jgi:hypothetical protein
MDGGTLVEEFFRRGRHAPLVAFSSRETVPIAR